jgi:Kef-type K+ transport system membrane component KefB
MVSEISFSPLLLITLLAFAVPILFSHIRIISLPIIVGEILCGIMVGKSGLGLIGREPWLDFLSSFGFVYLMFLSGLEIDFRAISPYLDREGKGLQFYLKNPVMVGILSAGLTLVVSLGLCQALSSSGILQLHWLIALLLSTTSIGVVVPVIKESRLSSTHYGQTTLLATMIADFVTMFLFTIGVAFVSKGITFEFLLISGIFVAFFVIYRGGHIFAGNKAIQTIIDDLSHATSQIRVRGCFVLMLFFVALSQQLGVEIILGSFLAGVIISLLSEGEGSDLRQKLDAIGYGFFIPIFFIMVGVGLDLNPLSSSLQPGSEQTQGAFWLVPLLLGLVYLARVLPIFAFRLLYPWRHSIGAASLLSARLSLSIAAAVILLRIGIIDQSLYAAIILMSILTCIVSPIAFHWLVPPKREGEKKQVVILGGNEVGCLLAERLTSLGEQVKLIEKDPNRAKRAKQMGFEVLEVDATTEEGLRAAGCDKATAFVAITTDDKTNIYACQLAKGIFGIEHLISLINNLGNLEKAEDIGIRVINPTFSLVDGLHNFIHHPSIAELLSEQVSGKKIVEIPLYESKYSGRPLKELHLPGDCLILSIKRDREFLIPRGNTILKKGDTITILGSEEFVAELRNQRPGAIFSLRDFIRKFNRKIEGE